MSAKELAEATKRMFLPFMQMKEFSENPLILAEGEGIYVTDVDGRRFIDGISGIFTCNVGYRNERVIEAVKAQLDRLHFHLLMSSTNERALELTDLLCEITPPQFNTVHLVSGGSEATETAMKIARQYHRQTGQPGRYKIISRYWAYHGGTLGALAASGGAVRKQVFEPFPTGFVHIPPPFCYRCPFNLEYDDCGIVCAEILDEVIVGEGAETVAAIREIMERDLAANAAAVGGRMKRKLVALADKHEVVGQVTGEGLLLGIEYVRDGATHEPFPEEVAFAKQVDAACRERGLITRPSAHVQIIAPPLILTDEQADEIVGTVDAAIGEVAARLAPRKSGTARKKPSAALTAGPGD